DVLVCVIGPDWGTAADATGRRRLDDEHDIVRWEVRTALERRIPVVPVLVGGAEMPADLPPDLPALPRRPSLRAGPGDFDAGAQEVVASVQRLFADSSAAAASAPAEGPAVADLPRGSAGFAEPAVHEVRRTVTILTDELVDLAEITAGLDPEAVRG